MIRAARLLGMHSSTTANAPAAAAARASARISSPERWTLWPPSFRTACGWSPTCPITGIPASTRARMVAAIVAPPSSFTAWQFVSLRIRPAERSACRGETW